jgi:hypothetical protein
MSLAVALLIAGLSTAALGPPPDNRNLVWRDRPGSACDPAALVQAGFAPARLRRLEDLPPAYHHLAVARTVAGCSIATVKIAGEVYWVPLNPQPRREIEPLTPAR